MKEILLRPSSQDAGGRIDIYIAQNTDLSRSRIKNLIESGKVFFNDKEVTKGGFILKEGQVKVLVGEQAVLLAQAEDIPLDIVYEDDLIAVINKPQGMVTLPAAGSPSKTLVNAALYHIRDLSQINGVYRPGIVHRLDKDTSGLLAIAKNDLAHLSLSKQIADRTAERYYIALVEGRVKEDQGVIDKPIARHKVDRKKMCVDEKGRKALTYYKVLERYPEYTLCEFKLHTGRTHQIRVHAKYINHAVVGDAVYGKKDKFGLDGQLLHAYKLVISHPADMRRMTFEAPLPPYFQEIVDKLRKKAGLS